MRDLRKRKLMKHNQQKDMGENQNQPMEGLGEDLEEGLMEEELNLQDDLEIKGDSDQDLEQSKTQDSKSHQSKKQNQDHKVSQEDLLQAALGYPMLVQFKSQQAIVQASLDILGELKLLRKENKELKQQLSIQLEDLGSALEDLIEIINENDDSQEDETKEED